MNDDLLPITGLDQSIQVNSETVMEKIDEALKRSLKEKNVYIALNVCKQLVAVGQVSGIGLAKALYFIEKNWEKYKVDEAFDDVVWDYIGKHKHTVERYVKVWGMFDNALVPQNYVEELQQRNIGELIPIANALYEGHEISEEQWEKLSEAPDVNTISKVIREDVKSEPPRKGSLQLYLDGEGNIWAFEDNVRYFAGHLEIFDSQPTIKKAITRIRDRSGILGL